MCPVTSRKGYTFKRTTPEHMHLSNELLNATLPIMGRRNISNTVVAKETGIPMGAISRWTQRTSALSPVWTEQIRDWISAHGQPAP